MSAAAAPPVLVVCEEHGEQVSLVPWCPICGSGSADAHVEAPPKPCCERIDHTNELAIGLPSTWCSLPAGHKGQHSGPLPRALPKPDLMPRKK